MGELFRQKQNERKLETSATDLQIALLRDLVVWQDGEVDEVWLASLSKAEASAEISRRAGKRPSW